MLTYFVAKKSYTYYKKQRDDRLYKEDVVRRSHAALVDPSATIRKLPPGSANQVAATSTELVAVTVPANRLNADTQETALVAYTPLPPPRTGNQETTLVAYTPPPPPQRSSRRPSGSVAQETTTVIAQTSRPAARAAPPPPPPKPAALSSAAVVRPKPPPKPAALSSAGTITKASLDQPPVSTGRQPLSRPQLPSRPGLGAGSPSAPVTSTLGPPSPALPARMAVRAISDIDEASLKRNKSIGPMGRADSNTLTRKYSFGGTEYAPKLRTYTPPPVVTPKATRVNSNLRR